MSKASKSIAERLASALQKCHTSYLGGVHRGGMGGCEMCALLREARGAGLLTGAWPSLIAWDGEVLNK